MRGTPNLFSLVALVALGGCAGTSSDAMTRSAAPDAADRGDGGRDTAPTDAPPITPSASVESFMRDLPASCAFDCKKGCVGEDVGPLVCPAMDDWARIPHDEACRSPDLAKPPPSTPGKCEADPPSGESLRRAGPIPERPGTLVLPDGHRLSPAGTEVILDDGDHSGGFPVAIARVPSTRFAVVVEAGFGEHLVRSIDLRALAAGTVPAQAAKVIVSTVVVPLASWGVVVREEGVGKHRVLVSGGASGRVHALSLDDTTGALKPDPSHAIDLGSFADGKDRTSFFASGIAATPDGKRLVAASVRTPDARVFSLEDGATYGTLVSSPLVGKSEQFGAAIDPADPSGEVAYVSGWANARLAVVDMKTGAVRKSIPLPKNPESVAFLDARWLVASSADGDALTLVDRVTGAATPVAIDVASKVAVDHRGWSPTALAYDAPARRLYVAEPVVNAVEVFDVARPSSSDDPPTLTSRGRIPTGWWPTDLALDPDARRLVVLNGRGHGTGTGSGKRHGPGEGEIAESMRGSVESIDLGALDLAELTTLSKTVAQNAALADVGGYPTVRCPPDAPYDFPVPRTNTEGPSRLIKHVVLVVRENKNFDGIFGDLPNVDGKPDLVLAPGRMDALWTNFRGIGRRWTIADNYYTDAEYSSQGHVWLTFGRTTDFTERIWMIAASKKGRELGGGVSEVGRPEEGSIFEWMLRHGVDYDILGEATGLPSPPKDKRNPLDTNYPGVAQNIGLEDVTKSCYFAGRARALCDLHDVVYMTLPNDHTFGGGGGRATPETMIAVNDEATGVVVDALGRSQFWPSTLVIVTEDDPQDGADHVDLHRTPLVMAGPWVKRGYVAKGHYDVASIIKLVAHVRGLPYPNEVVARAPLPLEMFTSTPDYAGWTMTPRTWKLGCNSKGSGFAREAATWDFTELDEQPGLATQVRRMLRSSAKTLFAETSKAEVAQQSSAK